ncbi:hypothetical protein [uncultured Alteromonas sp.]|uniref:hypothetical protein n=1 Tax=uncultured Alteromonas sp. TaxID=179113 RepID=UPI0025EA0384|nr:hypothetical protein [uncultured Alteromonas sp.]
MTTFTLPGRNRQLSIKHVAMATLAILLLPLTAGMLTSEVNWSVMDFIVMGSLIFITGSALLITVKHAQRPARLVLCCLTLVIFLFVWVELAVGIFFNLGR